MCRYCSEENKENDFEGMDGVYYNKKDNKYYLIVEHFRNERNKVEVKYCPQCGKKLE